MKTFFTSDTHFFHDNIRKLCNRPYDSVEEMNECMIQNWNKVVSKNDDVYHLGDFALGASPEKLKGVIDRLNFRTLHVVRGNHEKSFSSWHEKCSPKNVLLHPPYLEAKIEGVKIVLCHYPILSFNGYFHGSVHFYGHVHGTSVNPNPASADVGVDVRNFTPISLDEGLALVERYSP